MNNLASRYASALLSLALEENKNEAYRNYLKVILETIQDDSSLERILSCSTITKEEKKKIIDNSRGSYLKKMIEEFISLSNEKDGIAEGYIYSSSSLSKEDKERIEAAISKKLNKIVYLIPKIDQRLIGGFKVVVNDYVFDASIKNKIDGLKNSLLERGS